MRTIETTANIDHEGILLIELASDSPLGTHRAVLVIDESLSEQTKIPDQELTQPTEVTETTWSALRAQAGSVNMPEDWAKEHDYYLYGTPKRQT